MHRNMNSRSNRRYLSQNNFKLLIQVEGLKNHLGVRCKKLILEVRTMMRRQMNSLDTVGVMLTYSKTKLSTKVGKVIRKEVSTWLVVKHRQGQSQQNQNSKGKEKRTWKKLKCTIGPKLIKETQMKYTKFSIMPNCNSKVKMKCSK